MSVVRSLVKSVNHEIADVSAEEGKLDDEQGKGNPKNVSLYVFSLSTRQSPFATHSRVTVTFEYVSFNDVHANDTQEVSGNSEKKKILHELLSDSEP